jgi:hypothetical protein
VVAIAVTAVSERDASSWQEVLQKRLEGESVQVLPAGSLGAAAVDVSITEVCEESATDTGAPYHAAVCQAEVRIGRAAVRLTSRPGVARDRAEALRIAREDILVRIVDALNL